MSEDLTSKRSAISNIYVTQPLLPPLDEFVSYLEEIWNNKWLTNNGPFHQRLEEELARELGVEHISLFANGTIALITALQCLRITGEVITTPFSFVATAHSLHWNGVKPVFADIDPVSFNLDPARIEAAISPSTTAIMPVHVYGRPCDVDAIQDIAARYGLRVIYDAAHAFGVRIAGKSILTYGDLSVLSFHATKVFNTFEGGAIVCRDRQTKERIDFLKNFGFADETTVVAPGINGKMNELQAAFGLLQLKHIDQALERRRAIDAKYRAALGGIRGLRIPELPKEVTSNFSYFPVLFSSQFPVTRDALYGELKAHGILSRRYFYPLISEFPTYRGLPSASPNNLPVATKVASEILCLPIHPGLSVEEQQRVIDCILQIAA